MTGFSTLRVQKLPGPGSLWQLTHPLAYQNDRGLVLVVPAGFIADGNSSFIKHSASEAAGWTHDWLYRSHNNPRWTWSRAWADAIFHEALLADGVSPVYARAQWLVVRALGWRYWHRTPVNLARED